MTDTSKEAVATLSEQLTYLAVIFQQHANIEHFGDSPCGEIREIINLADMVASQPLTERDAEKARADKAESAAGKWAALGDIAAERNDLRAQLTAANEKLASARKAICKERRACEMSAELLQDPLRTSAWPGAVKAAAAFQRIGRSLDKLNDALATHPTTPASHEGQRERDLRLIKFSLQNAPSGVSAYAGMTCSDILRAFTAKESQ